MVVILLVHISYSFIMRCLLMFEWSFVLSGLSFLLFEHENYSCVESMYSLYDVVVVLVGVCVCSSCFFNGLNKLYMS